MRAWRHASAFEDHELIVVVLPVADTASQLWWKPAGKPVTAGTSRPLDPALRDIDAVPRLIDALPNAWRPDVLVVFRSYLAPVGLALADRLRPARAVLDLDEDDAAVLGSLGNAEADRFEQLVRANAPRFSVVTVASPAEADAVAERYRLTRVHVVPNGVDIPERPLDYGDRSRTVAMVGNFTYAPNVRGGQWLRDRVWPLLAGLGAEPCALRVVGPGVGEVDDITAIYRAAAVMAVPLFEGGGTRLKVLEAWALGRPLVSTTTGVAGLDVAPGRAALIADDPGGFADALATVLDDPARALDLISAGRETVERYRADRVEAALRNVALG
jgi:glycosyltransferase involved in cell wall biosynthesis